MARSGTFSTLLVSLSVGCTSHRWRAPAVPDDGGVRHTVPRPSGYGPPRPPYTVPTVRIPPGETTPCATDADCADHGFCFTPELEARYSQAFRDCADAQSWRTVHALHTCFHNTCTADTDCGPHERCALSGMLPFPQRICIAAPCKAFMDCRHNRLGACVSYLAGRQCEHGGWACAYPTDACFPGDPERRCTAPHGEIAYCVPRDGRFRCVTDPRPAP